MKKLLILVCVLGMMFGVSAQAAKLIQGDTDGSVYLTDTAVPVSTLMYALPGFGVTGMGVKSTDGHTGILYTGGSGAVWNDLRSWDLATGAPLQDQIVAPGGGAYTEFYGMECMYDGSAYRLFSLARDPLEDKTKLLEFNLLPSGLIDPVNTIKVVNQISYLGGDPAGGNFNGLAWNPVTQLFYTKNSGGWFSQMNFDGTGVVSLQYPWPGMGEAYQDGNIYSTGADAGPIVRYDSLVSPAAGTVISGDGLIGTWAMCGTTTPGASIPEPGLISLMLTGIAGLLFLRGRKK